jgi:hypothetical protein
MSSGDLRKEIVERFGDFFSRRGFVETYYFYDEKSFGNEILELRDEAGTQVRVTRDRSQIFVEIKSSKGLFVDSFFYLRALGHRKEEYWQASDADPPQPGIPSALVKDMMAEWPGIVALARNGFEVKTTPWA